MFSSMRRIAAIAALVTVAGLLTTVAAASAAGVGRPVPHQPGDDQRRGRRLAGLPRHRLDLGRRLDVPQGLHALLRQRPVNHDQRRRRG